MMVLQASDTYRTQTAGDIFSISKDLWNKIQGDMENQVYHIQSLLANGLNRCKGKGNSYIKNHIKKIKNVYKNEQWDIEQLIIVEKEKQKEDQIQEDVFLYEPYDISSKSSKSKMLEPTFVQDKINNLDKYIKYM